MLKRHTVTQQRVFTVYNNRFNNMDGVMRTVVMKKTEWKEDLYIAVKFVQYMLSKYYAKLTVTMGALPILPNLFDSFQKLPLFGKWGKRMDNTPVHVTTYTTQY